MRSSRIGFKLNLTTSYKASRSVRHFQSCMVNQVKPSSLNKSITQFIDDFIYPKSRVRSKAFSEDFSDTPHARSDIKIHDTQANLTLMKLLQEERIDQIQIFTFVANNINHSSFDNDLLEVVIFNFLQNDNINAATTLLHRIFNSVPTFKLSNELWSVYVDTTCRAANHLGALVIYHHLVDSISNYDGENLSAYNVDSSDVPFLLSTSVLEGLATIYQQYQDPTRIRGLLAYFKRFYSYIGHRRCYKTLRICLVEAYSSAQDLANALDAFRDLSYSFRGHSNPKNWEKLNKLQKTSVFTNHVWRRDNVKTNAHRHTVEIPSMLKAEVDIRQDMTAEKFEFELYNPLLDRNVYSSPDSVSMPILNGSIRTIDLPKFGELILNNVKVVMESNEKGILSLVPTILSTHYILHVFIVHALCELRHFKEALSILKRLPTLFPHVDIKTLIREENFLNIIHAIGEVVAENPEGELYSKKVLNDSMNFYVETRLTNKGTLSLSIYTCLISSVLKFSSTSIDDMVGHIEKYVEGRSSKGSYIMLEDEEYDKFESITREHPECKEKISDVVKRLGPSYRV